MSRTAVAPRFRGSRKIEFTDRTYPDPGPGQLLIAPRANALCGTDRGFYDNGAEHVTGHETAGVVVAAGPGTGTPIGTRGVIFLMDYCGTCRSCRLGATNQCSAKQADMGIADDGGFGPYELIHETIFFAITDDIDFTVATMLLDVMGTTGHALGRAELVRPDIESIYVAGAGPIGIGLLVMAKIRYGAGFPVHISDVSPWRREFAESLGGIPVDAADLSSVRRPDVAFDWSGKEVARRGALDILGQRGAPVRVGHGQSVTLDVSGDLIAPERAVLGSEYFRYDELAGNLAILRQHRALISSIITHEFPVTEIDRACELFFAGETGKVVVTQGQYS